MLRLSDSSSSNFNEIEPPKGLQIKQDNKFFSRLMSKETSMSNSPSMVYYGGASGAIPFMWELHPGTPKHLSPDAALPPLTPPPSYHHHHHSSSFVSNPKQKPKPMPKWSLKPTLFGSIFRKLISPRRNNDHSPLSSYSQSSLPSWSSYYGSGSSFSSVSSFMNRNVLHRRRGYFSCSRSPVHNCMYDDDDDLHESSTSRSCFGVKVKPMNLKEFRGCRSVVNMKKALMSFVNQD